MKEYLHLKAIDVPIYRGKFVIILTNSADKLRNHLPRHDDNYVFAHSWLENYKGNEGYFMVLNFHSKHANITHGTIAHEAIHCAHYISHTRGFVPDFNNDEPIAYLASWITDEAYKFINKHKLKVR